jgi:tryptophan 2,3-dioxygenase
VVINHLHMLEHLSPWDYQAVRSMLGHGAGFDSPGFRRILAGAPGLGQAFHAARERRGVSLIDLYLRSAAFEDLYQAAEQLLSWDERIMIWRFHHLKLVERIIGGQVIGTQGTPVEALGRRIPSRFFPELWDVRNELTRMAGRPDAGHG